VLAPGHRGNLHFAELLPTNADGAAVQHTESSIGHMSCTISFCYHFPAGFAGVPEKICIWRTRGIPREIYARRRAQMADGFPEAILRESIQALVFAGRTEGRFGEPVAARRLAHAQRRAGGAVVARVRFLKPLAAWQEISSWE